MQRPPVRVEVGMRYMENLQMKEPPIDAIKEDFGHAEQQLVEYKKKASSAEGSRPR